MKKITTRERPHTLVIGGTRGIGKAVVKTFVEQNHLLSVIGLRTAIRPPSKSKGVSYWSVDLSDKDRLSSTLSEITGRNGKVRNLIFLQRYRGDGDAWQGELDISLTATKTVIEHLAARFERGASNSIVIIGSSASQFVAEEQPVGYHAAKAALAQMARYYALALGPKKIRVNCVTPGTVLKEESKEFYLRNTPLQNLYRQITPLGRMGTAEEIAGVVAFLCSEKASFITGQNIVVDGGISLQWQEGLARKLAKLIPTVKDNSTTGDER